MKRYFFLYIFLLLACSEQVYGQKQGRALLDSLLQELPKAKDDTNKVKMIKDLSYEYCFIKPDEAIKYAQQGIELATKLKWEKGIAMTTNNLGNGYLYNSDCPKALEFFQKALKIYEDIDDKTGVAKVTGNIGNVYLFQSNYPKALDYFLKALKVHEELGNKTYIANVAGSIGSVYERQNDYSKALEYNLKALKINEEMGDSGGIEMNTGSIGTVYTDQKNYPKALEYDLKSLKIAEATGDKNGIESNTVNIGVINLGMKNYAVAIYYMLNAVKMAKEIRDKNTEGVNLCNIADCFIKFGKEPNLKINYKEAAYALQIKEYPSSYAIPADKSIRFHKAINYLLQALAIGNELQALDIVHRAYQQLAEVYELSGDYKKAFEYNEKYHAVTDSLFSIEDIKKEAELQDKYDNDKREDSLKAANDKQMALTAQAGRAKIKGIILIGISLLVIGLLLIYFYRKRENYKFQQQISAVRQEALNAQMSDHFIGNAMDSIKGFIENNEKEKASEYLVLFNRLIRKVLENSFKKQVPLYEELEVLDMYITLEKLRFPPGALQYEIAVDKELDAENTFIPPMILQVLSENAIKHGFNKAVGGTLKIKVEKKGSAIACTVEDNGIGRQTARQSRSDADKKRISFGGSLAEKLINASSGADWKSFYKITDLSDGNGNATGTRVEFTLPFIFEAQS